MAGLIKSLSRDKSKEELEKSKRRLVFDLEEVNIKLKRRYKLCMYTRLCVLCYFLLKEIHPMKLTN